jgi:hypothetical protein
MTTAKRTHRWLAGSGLAAILAASGFGCSGENTANPPLDDIDHPWACATGEDGVVRAEGTVTNRSSKPSSYVVTVEFTDDGEDLGSASASVDHVDPGETTELIVSSGETAHGDADCTVDDVARFKA